MKRRNEKKHVIDFLFPLAVFFVLAASSVAIVVLASGFYSRQVKASSDSYSGRTALAYVTEKVHQNDENGAIADGTFDGENALVIWQHYGEKEYVTYLYAYDGYLRELFIQDGTEAKASDGRKILETKDFGAKEISDGIFHLYCENEDGKKDRYICQCEERCKIDWRRFMERTPAKRSSLFLLELMIAI